MQPRARFRLPDGQRVELGPGDLIGRSDRAALCLLEPHVSEAHAMVSLRSGELRLLALRGRFTVDGKPSAQATLRAGQRVVLASRTPLLVEEVRLPDEALAIVDGDLPPQLVASVCSLHLAPDARLVVGFSPEADAVLWTSGDRLFARVGGGATRELSAGDTLVVAERALRVVRVRPEVASRAATQDSAEVGAPLHLILNFDTVHIIAGPQRLTLDGIAARIVSELAAVRAPIAWQEIAREIWGRDDLPEAQLRERWDSSLARLRRRLGEARVRTNLVHSTRGGHVELVLDPGDTLEDRL